MQFLENVLNTLEAATKIKVVRMLDQDVGVHEALGYVVALNQVNMRQYANETLNHHMLMMIYNAVFEENRHTWNWKMPFNKMNYAVNCLLRNPSKYLAAYGRMEATMHGSRIRNLFRNTRLSRWCAKYDHCLYFF